MTKSKQRSIIALALLRLATSNEESKQTLKVHRTLKIKQRRKKETRNDFEESSKNYSEMHTRKASVFRNTKLVFGMSD